MTAQPGLNSFQIRVATIFFSLPASRGYVVAGGAGLLASDLISRPTQDIDLFSYAPTTSVTAARDALSAALVVRGWTAWLVVDSPSFCRLHVVGDDEVLVDLAIDSPPASPTLVTRLGPTLAPLDLATRKVLALFGRAEARDFADVFVLAARFGKPELLERAAGADAGFDIGVLAQMMRTLSRFDDEEIPVDPARVAELREYFAQWSGELGDRPTSDYSEPPISIETES